MSWAEHALCANMFGPGFGLLPTSEQVAACQHCRVRSECLEDALADERLTSYRPTGVRGGLASGERQELLAAERKAA